MSDWDESKHPRDKGKFSGGSGGPGQGGRNSQAKTKRSIAGWAKDKVKEFTKAAVGAAKKSEAESGKKELAEHDKGSHFAGDWDDSKTYEPRPGDKVTLGRQSQGKDEHGDYRDHEIHGTLSGKPVDGRVRLRPGASPEHISDKHPPITEDHPDHGTLTDVAGQHDPKWAKSMGEGEHEDDMAGMQAAHEDEKHNRTPPGDREPSKHKSAMSAPVGTKFGGHTPAEPDIKAWAKNKQEQFTKAAVGAAKKNPPGDNRGKVKGAPPKTFKHPITGETLQRPASGGTTSIRKEPLPKYDPSTFVPASGEGKGPITHTRPWAKRQMNQGRAKLRMIGKPKKK